MPSPNKVGSGDLYERLGPDPLINKTATIRQTVMNTIRDPDQADGWPAILIPALATGLAVSIMRRYI